MNILIPHTWLLEHLDTQATPQEIQRLLSLSGPSVERIYSKEGEEVYDIEITTNRVDSLSVRGIAREAAVILSEAGIPATLKSLDIQQPKATKSLPFPQVTNTQGLCKRTMGVILDNVEHTPTPEWMAKRIRQTDQNVHDSVIDITNYVTHELGHPCHAFDYDKVMALGGQIHIVEAQKGQEFVTLDKAKYTTVGGEVVFVNPKGEIIDLPAIMGTLNSSVDSTTKRVLLWIESIPAKKVRHASMTHAIRTTAAQLNEKNVDPQLADSTLARGVQLYQELCNATIASEVFDEFPGKTQPYMNEVTLSTFSRYLGIELPVERIITILETLECVVTHSTKKATLLITPPSFRPDLQIPADYVEEVARIYGYHNLPSVIMDGPIPLLKQEGVNFFLEEKIKRYLATLGWQEVFTYSMVSEEIAKKSGYTLDQHLILNNPLTDDRTYLRRSHIPSLIELSQNNTQSPEQSYFEMAAVYHPQDGAQLPKEVYMLTLLSTDEYRTFRGHIESLLKSLFITNYQVVEGTPKSGYSQTAQILLLDPQKTHLGSIHRVDTYWACELEVGGLVQCAATHPVYQPLPKTAVIKEDLTFTVPAGKQVGDIIQLIKAIDKQITTVELMSVYKQNYTFKLWYYNPDTSLSNTDVAPLRLKVVQTIEKEYQAQLVGTLSK